MQLYLDSLLDIVSMASEAADEANGRAWDLLRTFLQLP